MEYSDKIKNKYDEEPVYFCERCLSLAIIHDDGDCYCKKCSSTRIKRTNIYRWLDIKRKSEDVLEQASVMKQCLSKI